MGFTLYQNRPEMYTFIIIVYCFIGVTQYTHVLTFGLDRPLLETVADESKISMLEGKKYQLKDLFQVQTNPVVDQYLAQSKSIRDSFLKIQIET